MLKYGKIDVSYFVKLLCESSDLCYACQLRVLEYGFKLRLESSINHLKHCLARTLRKIKYSATCLVLYFL